MGHWSEYSNQNMFKDVSAFLYQGGCVFEIWY